MQTINKNNLIGLQTELAAKLHQSVAELKDEWSRTYSVNYDFIRINPLQAELYPSTSLGLYEFSCRHCGAIEIITLPIPLDEMGWKAKKFLKQHKKCLPKVGAEDVQPLP